MNSQGVCLQQAEKLTNPLSETPSRDFEDALMKAIDEVILALLGPGVLQSLYTHLDKHHSITRDDLPYRLDMLFTLLEETLGVQSARTIGRTIAKAFYSRLKIEFRSSPNHTLLDYVEEAKRNFQVLRGME